MWFSGQCTGTDPVSTLKENLKPDNLNDSWKRLLASIESETRIIKETGPDIIPVIEYDDFASQSLRPDTCNEIRKRGVVVIRNTIPEDEVRAWNSEVEKYVCDHYRMSSRNKSWVAAMMELFKPLVNQSGIFEAYHSLPQVQARQHERMAAVRRTLNRLWKWHSDDNTSIYFDPDRECSYLDRFRVRRPKSVLDLAEHIDNGSVERWEDDGYQKVYRDIFEGNWESYNPFDAQYRNVCKEHVAANNSTVFRTYQGWLALTPQGPGDGTLEVVPLLRESTAHVLLRPFLDDVPSHVLCGANKGDAQQISKKYHRQLIEAKVSIPKVHPGDTVWWHPDIIHSVQREHRGTSHANVLYIPAAPLCTKNVSYLVKQRETFPLGNTPPDFPRLNIEAGFQDRGTVQDLSCLGKRQMGFEKWPCAEEDVKQFHGDDAGPSAMREFIETCNLALNL